MNNVSGNKGRSMGLVLWKPRVATARGTLLRSVGDTLGRLKSEQTVLTPSPS